MTFTELKKTDRCEVAYLSMLCNLVRFKQRIDKITLYRKRNEKGRYVANITCYLCDIYNNIHPFYVRLFDEEYLWFLCAVADDFPEVELEDLTAEKDKVGGVDNDLQASEET